MCEWDGTVDRPAAAKERVLIDWSVEAGDHLGGLDEHPELNVPARC